MANQRNLHGQDPSRDDVLQWIREHEGEVDFEGNDPNGAVITVRLDRTRGIDPGFSMDRICDNDFSKLSALPDIRELTLENRPDVTQVSLLHLAKLEKLRILNLSQTRVTGISLESLADLPSLTDIKLNCCARLSDDDMKSIALLKRLKRLELTGYPAMGQSEDGWRHSIQIDFASGRLDLSFRDELENYTAGVSNAGIAELVGLHEIQHLSLALTRIDDQGLETISQFPNLTSLDLSRTAVTDAGLAALGRLIELKSLRLNCLRISDEGLASLSGLTNLEELELRCSTVTEEGLKHLKKCSAMRRLDLSKTAITDSAIDVLQEFRQLEELKAVGTRISMPGVFRLCQSHPKMDLKSAIVNCGLVSMWGPFSHVTESYAALTSLAMKSDRNVDNNTLATLSDHELLSGLHDLDLSRTSVTDDGLRYLQNSEGLESLILEGTSVTDAGLPYLKKLTKLNRLPIRNSQLTLRGIIHLIVTLQQRPLEDVFQVAGLNRDTRNELFPTALDLHDRRVSDDDLKIIATASNLDTLLLQGNPISDAGLDHITKIPQLRKLWVSGNGITGGALAKLHSLQSLETLWLTDTQATEADLETLARMPQLATLNLSGMTFSKDGIDRLKKLKNLETLIVDSSALSPADIVELQASNPELSIIRSQKRALAAIRGAERTSYHLPQGWHRVQESAGVSTDAMDHPLVEIFGDAHFEQANRLGDSRFRSPAKHWKDLPTLESVTIIDIEHPIDEIAALKDIPALKDVRFYGSVVSDNDLKEIGVLPLVKQLDLSETKVTDASLEYVVQLPQLESLTLGCYSTRVGDAGLQHLARAKNLKMLDLSRTNITDAGMAHFEGLHQLEVLKLREVRIDDGLQYLTGLKNLRELDLHNTLVSDESLEYLYGLENLRVVGLSNTMISESGAQKLRERLTDIQVSVEPISEEARKLVRPFGQLRIPMSRDSNDEIEMLDFRRREHFVETLPLVLKLKSLKELRIGSEGSDEILKRVAEIATLETLNLWESKVTSPGLLCLHSLPNLKNLYLVRMELTGDAVACLGDFSRIEGLSLIETNVGDADLVFLEKMPQLKYLYLDGTEVTKACLTHLDKLTHLEYLCLKDTKIDPEEVREFERTHPACKVVFER